MKVFLEVVLSLYELLVALIDKKKWIHIVVYWSLPKIILRCLLCFHQIKRSMIPLVNTIFSEVTDSDYTRGVRSIRQLLDSYL